MDLGIPSHPAPSDPPEEGFAATAGEPLADGVPVAGEEAVIEAAEECPGECIFIGV